MTLCLDGLDWSDNTRDVRRRPAHCPFDRSASRPRLRSRARCPAQLSCRVIKNRGLGQASRAAISCVPAFARRVGKMRNRKARSARCEQDGATMDGGGRAVARRAVLLVGGYSGGPRGLTIEQAGKTGRYGACNDFAHELTQAHFAELRLEGQRCDDFIRKAQRDGPFETSEVHRQPEICAVHLLALDVVWPRCCSLVLLRPPQEQINLFKGEPH